MFEISKLMRIGNVVVFAHKRKSKAPFVAYINTNAATKAVKTCCTSAECRF